MPEHNEASSQTPPPERLALTWWWPEAGDWFQVLQQSEPATSWEGAKQLNALWPFGRRLISRGDRYPDQKHGQAAQASYLFHQPQTLPEAPVLAHLLPQDAEGVANMPFWVVVSPVQMIPDRDTLRLFPPETLALDEAEGRALLASFNAHFESDGVQLHYLAPDIWLLGMPQAIDLQTTHLIDAAGQSVDQRLPTGAAATYWHSLINEAQMLFHQHPVNQRRQEAGRPQANGVWFWGEGVVDSEKVQARPQAAIAGESLYLKGLAQLTDAQAWAPCQTYQAWLKQHRQAPDCRHSLVDVEATLPALTELVDREQALALWADLEKDWFAPIFKGLKSGELGSVFLHLGTLGQYYLTPKTARRFWRLPRSIKQRDQL
ncbi:hypothetical protein [Thiomicrospira sp. WB1]|uniref:hypothetical protein n=1 Tax=Thiomicrospira sp. WB1 TaxID=1685380 RepID=UPI00074947B6|nr:hypothetical protein [Thiomicrospira sp. WB1]KUJ72073.1 hypothetical protein AVO41_06450 [Thiomicrospira sp. WB1]